MQVNYINAHATSTLVGDVAEVKAIKKVFTDMSHVKVNGTKSLIGHCLGAAGGLEAVATIQAIRTGWLHPTLNQVLTLAHLCKAQRLMPVNHFRRIQRAHVSQALSGAYAGGAVLDSPACMSPTRSQAYSAKKFLQ